MAAINMISTISKTKAANNRLEKYAISQPSRVGLFSTTSLKHLGHVLFVIFLFPDIHCFTSFFLYVERFVVKFLQIVLLVSLLNFLSSQTIKPALMFPALMFPASMFPASMFPASMFPASMFPASMFLASMFRL